MRAGVEVSILLLACIFSARGQEVNALQDLKSPNPEEDSRSGAIAESLAISNNGQGWSESGAETSGDGSAKAQSMSSSHKGANKAMSMASANNDAEAYASSSSNADASGIGSSYFGGSSSKAESSAKAKYSAFKPGYQNMGESNIYQPGFIYPGVNNQENQAESEGQIKNGGLVFGKNQYGGAMYQPSYFNPRQDSTGKSQSTASAQADAQVVSGVFNGRPGLYGTPGYQPEYVYPGQTIQAGTNRPVIPGGSGNKLVERPLYNPGNMYFGQGTHGGEAQAQANSQAISGGMAQGPLGEPSFYQGYPYSGYGGNPEGSQQIPQQVGMPANQIPHGGSMYQPGQAYPGSATATANADSAAGFGFNFNINPHKLLHPYWAGGRPSAEAHPRDEALGYHGQFIPSAPTDIKSRVIQLNEIIYPHLMPGYDNAILCTRFGELHYLQSGLFGCMVCACVNEDALLVPACASCSSCFVPEPEPGPQTPLTPTTISPIPTTRQPQPETQVTCSPLPSNEPFESPLNPCQICVCVETYNFLMKSEVRIECRENPQCVVPQDITTLPPIPDGPVPLAICERFPPNVVFPHPNDACKLCKCLVGLSQQGRKEAQIECSVNPECMKPEDLTIAPPIPDRPTPLELCERYPPNVFFPHPNDACRLCKCLVGLALQGGSGPQIECVVNPECTPTTELPAPLELCERHPPNMFFPHPNDACRLCKCLPQQWGAKPQIECVMNPECTPTTELPIPLEFCERHPPNVFFPHPNDACRLCKCIPQQWGAKPQIECVMNPECTPTTELPVPLELCERHPPNVFFPDPNDACRLCKCIPQQWGAKPQIECVMNPECTPTTELPVPLELCEGYPPNVFFPHPNNVCKLCKCVSQQWGAKPQIECIMNPECTPTTELPAPLELCERYPLNVFFPHPNDACRLCKCIPQQWGAQPQIECVMNPECTPTTELPAPLELCERYTPNVLFPHPSDACRLCKCLVVLSPLGQPEFQFECSVNPECNPVTYQPDPSTFPDANTVFPWVITTPNPQPKPGPLPGPKPHESCKPFTPDEPFQHPWDECQMCICSESISVSHTTVEVNCYTKWSCCYEPPEPLGWAVTALPNSKDIQIMDPICEMKSFGVEFIHPQDSCKTCFCDLRGNIVKPICYRSETPECKITGYQNEGGYSAEAYAESHSSAGGNKIIPQGGQIYGPGYGYGNQPVGPGANSQELLDYRPGKITNYPNQGGYSAEAYAEAYSGAGGNKIIPQGDNIYGPGYGYVNQPIAPGANSQDQLDNRPGKLYKFKPDRLYAGQSWYKPVNVNDPGFFVPSYDVSLGNQGFIDGNGQWEGITGYGPGLLTDSQPAMLEADAIMGSGNGYAPIYPTYTYPDNTNINNKNTGGIVNKLEQKAMDLWLSNAKKLGLQQFGGNIGTGGDLYNNEASAIANAKQSSYGQFDANLFQRPGYQPLYTPSNGYENFIPVSNPNGSGGAIAQSSAFAQGSNAMSKAKSNAWIDKSGDPELFGGEEEPI